MKNLKVDKVINKIKIIKEKYPIMTFYIIGNFINAIFQFSSMLTSIIFT